MQESLRKIAVCGRTRVPLGEVGVEKVENMYSLALSLSQTMCWALKIVDCGKWNPLLLAWRDCKFGCSATSVVDLICLDVRTTLLSASGFASVSAS